MYWHIIPNLRKERHIWTTKNILKRGLIKWKTCQPYNQTVEPVMIIPLLTVIGEKPCHVQQSHLWVSLNINDSWNSTLDMSHKMWEICTEIGYSKTVEKMHIQCYS